MTTLPINCLRLLATAVVLPVLLGGGGSAAAAPAELSTDDVVRINFDYLTGAVGEPVTVIKTQGTASVAAAIVQRNDGQVLVADARAGQGDAVSLPAFDVSATSERAVIRITNAAAGDQLSPGARPFSFGADFVLDATSAAHGTTDDGDNLVQRGLYDDSDQYKLQLDGRYASCRLKGSAGATSTAIDVTSTLKVDSTHWYRAECTRTGRMLQVVVRRFNDDGTSTTVTNTVMSAATINVTMSAPTVALSVGGKLNADGTVAVNTDEFNGRVDNAFLRYS